MRYLFITLFLISFLFSCNRSSTPKPSVYFRLYFPEHSYQKYISESCPYSFEAPIYSKIEDELNSEGKDCWKNIVFSQYKANIHLTFKYLNNNLDTLLDDSHTLVYKHTVKADAINASDYTNDSLQIFATIFNIDGNAASPLQFHITDSINYFVRGSLYFNVVPNYDSLYPAIVFLKEDVIHLIETFEWQRIKN